jgi:sulfur relay (sulfurtransferase) DsrF/TusC family protein
VKKDSEMPDFALLIRSHPYQRRSARAELDVALAALVMDYRVEVYFLGSSVLQLLVERNSEAAGLPPAYRAWASLPELGECSLFAQQHWLDKLSHSGSELLLPVQVMGSGPGWRHCKYSMVI